MLPKGFAGNWRGLGKRCRCEAVGGSAPGAMWRAEIGGVISNQFSGSNQWAGSGVRSARAGDGGP